MNTHAVLQQFRTFRGIVISQIHSEHSSRGDASAVADALNLNEQRICPGSGFKYKATSLKAARAKVRNAR